jgi:D-alanyl-D-alanine carboxypeptidase
MPFTALRTHGRQRPRHRDPAPAARPGRGRWRAAALVLGALLSLPLAGAPARADAIGGEIQPETVLGPGEIVTSASGAAHLDMETNGDLVLYAQDGTRVWETGTGGEGNIAKIQGDGNFVVYTAAGQPIWHVASHDDAGATLTVQDDLRLVLRGAGGRVLWQTMGPMVNIDFARRVDLVQRDLREAGWPAGLLLSRPFYGGYRTFAQQQAIIRRCPSCTRAGPGRSWHNYGVAADIAYLPNPAQPPQAYDDAVGRIAESYGLIWGGRFRSLYDPTHVELHPVPAPSFGTLIAVSQRGTQLRSVWDLLGLP